MSSRLEESEAYKTQQENTRTAPRFTEVEREAIEDALISMKIMLQSEKINFPNFHRERIEKYEKNIATFRAMLAESEVGK